MKTLTVVTGVIIIQFIPCLRLIPGFLRDYREMRELKKTYEQDCDECHRPFYEEEE